MKLLLLKIYLNDIQLVWLRFWQRVNGKPQVLSKTLKEKFSPSTQTAIRVEGKSYTNRPIVIKALEQNFSGVPVLYRICMLILENTLQ